MVYPFFFRVDNFTWCFAFCTNPNSTEVSGSKSEHRAWLIAYTVCNTGRCHVFGKQYTCGSSWTAGNKIFLKFEIQLNVLLSNITGKQTNYRGRSSVHPEGRGSTVLVYKIFYGTLIVFFWRSDGTLVRFVERQKLPNSRMYQDRNAHMLLVETLIWWIGKMNFHPVICWHSCIFSHISKFICKLDNNKMNYIQSFISLCRTQTIYFSDQVTASNNLYPQGFFLT